MQSRSDARAEARHISVRRVATDGNTESASLAVTCATHCALTTVTALPLPGGPDLLGDVGLPFLDDR